MELRGEEGFVFDVEVEVVDEDGILVWGERGSFGEKGIRDWKFVGDACVPVANERGFGAERVYDLFRMLCC